MLILILLLVTAQIARAEPATSYHPRGVLTILNWSDYMDPGIVEAFEDRYRVEVNEVYFDSDDGRDEMLQATNGKGYDLVLVNGVMLNFYAKRDWLMPLDQTRIPNLRHIDDRWRDAFPAGRRYGVPYFWGNIGIAYRKDLIKIPPSRWMELFRPSPDLYGKIIMMPSARDLIGMALKAMGASVNSEDPKQLDHAESLLLGQKPYVRGYANLELAEDSALVSGEIVVAMMDNGDALMAQERNPNIAFVVPTEGTNLWVDYFAVMKASPNRDLAMGFLDFINEPKNAARLALHMKYATPNRAAEAFLPPEFFKNPVIYPNKNVLGRSEFYKELSPRTIKRKNSIWAKIIN